ncbi:Hypothetical protein NGAL_HAMBI2605_57900 [Neorhizobium galegae bv. orientalis]|nr:Hypothetical protein NGAL_HAMBI2605_57900 [Neorhizobium galegae bv. orientalis]
MMCSGACLHTDEAWFDLLEESQKLPSTKLLLEDDYTSRVDGVYLEDILGEIDSESKLAHNIDLSHHHLPSTSIGGSGGGVHTIKIVPLSGAAPLWVRTFLLPSFCRVHRQR